MATFAELIDQTYRLLQQAGDQTANQNFPLASVKAWINAGMWYVERTLNLPGYKLTATVDAAPAGVALPSTFGYHLEVWLEGRKLQETIPISPAETVTSETPGKYFIEMSTSSTATQTIKFSPALTSTIASGLKYRYTPAQAAMTANSDVPYIMSFFPEQQLTVIPYYAASQAYMLDDDVENMQKYDALMKDQITAMRSAYAQRSYGGVPAR